MSHTNNGDLLHGLGRIFLFALFVGLVGEICFQLLQISLCSDTVDGHDLHHSAVLFAVPYIRLLKRLNLKRLNDKVTGFNGVAEEVIVIDIVDLKAGVLHIIGIERLLRKLLSDTDQTLGSGLNRSEVNTAPRKRRPSFIATA